MKIYLGISAINSANYKSQHQAGLSLLSQLGKDFFSDGNLPKVAVSPSGRPCFSDSQNYDFNISHSKSCAICVISQCKTGCDIQYTKRKINIDMGKRFFHEDEYNSILNESDKNQQEKLFYKLWVLKEAYIKLLGLSIADIKKTPSFFIKDNKIQCFSASAEFFYILFESTDYLLAVALEKKPDLAEFSVLHYDIIAPDFELRASNF